MKTIQKSNAGRPTKLDDECVRKLESIFKIGGNIEEATSYAGIARPTYYEWCEKYPDFLTKMEAARHYADIAAKNVVVNAIIQDKDLATAKWWLEKREFKNVGFQIGGDNAKIQFNIISGGYVPKQRSANESPMGNDNESLSIQDSDMA